MRATAVRRTALAATVALVTACGGGEEEGEAKDARTETSKASVTTTAAPAASAAPAAKALYAAELEELVVAAGDLKGYEVEQPKGTIGSSAVTVDKDACKPIADALFALPHHLAFASVQREAVPVGAPMTTMSLGSFEGNNAQEVFATLRASATACAGGFTVSVLGDPMKVRSVSPMTVSGGDEVLAWKVKSAVSADTLMTSLVVSRTKNNVGTFSTVSLARAWDKAHGQAVIDAQAAKLG
ncbi:hypothetical protein [Streptomyces sp. NPDC046332]|uniref:hypothetical protein n=1 Tax=Streptomyces sp. NPDC046332 TaxID=3155133 RepID=UPI0033C2EDA3